MTITIIGTKNNKTKELTFVVNKEDYSEVTEEYLDRQIKNGIYRFKQEEIEPLIVIYWEDKSLITLKELTAENLLKKINK